MGVVAGDFADESSLLPAFRLSSRSDIPGPPVASHNLSVWSSLPLTIRLPSGLKATPWILDLCPLRESSSRRCGGSCRCLVEMKVGTEKKRPPVQLLEPGAQ